MIANLLRIVANGLIALTVLLAGCGTGFARQSVHSLVTGVNRTNLAWLPPQVRAETLTRISQSGVGFVRLTWRDPQDNMLSLVEAAAKSHVGLFIEFPLDSHVVVSGSVRRAGNSVMGARWRMSDLDIARFVQRFDAALEHLHQLDVQVVGFQVANELNWADFNGDFPVQSPGEVWSTPQSVPAVVASGISAGYKKYGELLKKLKASSNYIKYYGQVPLVAAGLADVSPVWARRNGGTVLTQETAIKMLQEAGALGSVDAIALHVYQPLQGSDLSQDQFAQMIGLCGRSEYNKLPCWLTEVGTSVSSGEGECDLTDARRLRILTELMHTIEKIGPQRIQGIFLYDWDQTKQFSYFRCGSLTRAGTYFSKWKAPPGQ